MFGKHIILSNPPKLHCATIQNTSILCYFKIKHQIKNKKFKKEYLRRYKHVIGIVTNCITDHIICIVLKSNECLQSSVSIAFQISENSFAF